MAGTLEARVAFDDLAAIGPGTGRRGRGRIMDLIAVVAIAARRIGQIIGAAAFVHERAFGEMRRGFDRNLSSEEHTSELPSLMRIPSAVFCLKNNKTKKC